ncbi:MAG TPA: phosphoribosyltransferase family protein [Chitinophagaceae bacterium]|nr:phosphoribosyltransferase family protein [Chitinophagaceae bacterium]
MKKTSILDIQSIQFRIRRMAYEVWEKHSQEKKVYLIGIKDIGFVLANRIQEILKEISPLEVEVIPLEMDKSNPLNTQEELFINLKDSNVVLIDDVANSGKTLAFAMRRILNIMPKKFTIAVLVDRQHKNFPIRPDIIGLSLSTTIQEHIWVSEEDGKIVDVYLT